MQKGDFLWLAALGCILVLLFHPVTNETYVLLNREHPFLLGFAKFFVLATMGELLSLRMAKGQWVQPPGLLARAVVWGILGAWITLMFAVFASGIASAMQKGMLPGGESKFMFAFFTSVASNLSFAPTFMAFHKLTDAWIDLSHAGQGKVSLGQTVAHVNWGAFVSFTLVVTLPCIWIPVHTVTFLLPPEYRVLAAALSSILLGALLAMKKPQNKAAA